MTITSQKSFFLNKSLDNKKSCRAIALGADNSFWVADDASVPSENVYLYRMNAETGAVLAQILLEKPKGIDSLNPKYICYSTSKDQKGAWVSTFDGLLYFASDSLKGESSIKSVYDSKGESQFLGLTYDTDNDIIWIADQRLRKIHGFDAAKAETVSVPKHSVASLDAALPSLLEYDARRKVVLVSHEQGAAGKIASFKLTDASATVFTDVEAVIQTYGMTLDPLGGLYVATDKGVFFVPAGEKTANRFSKDKKRALMVCIDNCNYVWVTDGKNTVREYNELGDLVQSYLLNTPVGGGEPKAYGLVHCIKNDTFLITDNNLNGEVISLKPADHIPEGVTPPFKATAAPLSGYVSKKGAVFAPWKIKVLDAKGKAVITTARLWVDNAANALFGSSPDVMLEIKASGDSEEIKNLTAMSDKGAFSVYSSIRQPGGAGEGHIIYTGTIGTFSKISVADVSRRYTWINHHFEQEYPLLNVHYEPSAKVHLELSPANLAHFAQGPSQNTIEVPVVPDNYAKIPDIIAGKDAGELQIGYRIMGETAEQGHLTWYINELPKKVQYGQLPEIESEDVLKQQATLIIRGTTLPIKGATVKLKLRYNSVPATPPFFYEMTKPGIPVGDTVFLTTDVHGTVNIGGKTDKYGLAAGSMASGQIFVEILVPVDPSDAQLDEIHFNIVI